MKIEFKTAVRKIYGEEEETHYVYVDGKHFTSQSESIEPEDCRFYRDLSSPHDFASLIERVIAAVKAGEEVIIEHSEEDEEF